MKLKTLKDFNECKYMLSGVCEHCLKQEAINWAKESRKLYARGCQPYISNEVIVWIKEFFNITEEDLK